MQEIWKDVVGYEGHYQVSNLGNVKSLHYKHQNFPQVLKPKISYDGYLRVNLAKDGTVKTINIHLLVAKHFIPNPDNKPQINHINGDKNNNSVSNLEWVTGKENIRHAIDTGLRKIENHKYLKGGGHYASKGVLQYDLEGNLIKKWNCQSDIAREYNCRTGTVNAAILGRNLTFRKTILLPYEGKIVFKIDPQAVISEKRCRYS